MQQYGFTITALEKDVEPKAGWHPEMLGYDGDDRHNLPRGTLRDTFCAA